MVGKAIPQPTFKSLPTQSARASSPVPTPSQLETAQQQQVLDVFRITFCCILSSPNFPSIVQQVKAALFNRDFDSAFSQPDHLEAYAARWSPTRALCYASIISAIVFYLGDTIPPGPDADGQAGLHVLSIGGGAAELAAVGSYLSRQPSSLAASIVLLDAGPWAGVVDSLRTALTTAPPLSKFASAAAQAANAPLVSPTRFKRVTFTRKDALSLSKADLSSLVPRHRPILVTLLFTLNELLTAGGLGRTTMLLLRLTSMLPSGSLLLVVDSPGTYSETTVGKHSNRYPMHWLLDNILVGAAEGAWYKIESQDSVWFRLSPKLKYPIPLEDMRYQMHLYRATGNGLADG